MATASEPTCDEKSDRAAPPLALLIILSALAVLPVNLFLPSLPSIAHEFAADYRIANIAVAGYAVATAFIHLLAGALSDRYGRKPIVTLGLAVFITASIGCCLATGIACFLLFRVLQATVIAGYAVSLAIIRDTSESGQSVARIGYVSSAWAVAPMLGPMLGGLLDTVFGWRSSFVLCAVLGFAALLVVIFCLRETNLQPVQSIASQFRGLGTLLHSRNFLWLASCMMFAIGTLYAFLGAAPLVAAQLGITSALMTGVCMALVPTGFIAGSMIVGRLGSRRPAGQFMLLGRLITCAAMLTAVVLAQVGVNHVMAFFGPCILLGLGNGLTMPAANARVLALNPGLAGTASGLASAITVIGAGFIAFASGLTLDVPDPRTTVLWWMLGASLLSLVAAAVSRRSDLTGHPRATESPASGQTNT